MDTGCKGRAWVENLCHRFSIFCSEADDIICKDSVNYVRTQLTTAGENLMHMCSELVDGVLPEFSVDSARENGPASPTHEQDVNFPAQKLLSTVVDTDLDGKSCTMNPVGERCIHIQSDGKDEVSNRFDKQALDGDKCHVHACSLSSAEPPAANSSAKTEESKNSCVEFQEYELSDDKVTCPSSGCTRSLHSNGDGPLLHSFLSIQPDQPSCCQNLEESIIMVNTRECYSDSDMETNHISLENTEVKVGTLKKKKIANKCSFESASQVTYSETYQMTEKCYAEFPCAKNPRIVNEDFCDWEII